MKKLLSIIAVISLFLISCDETSSAGDDSLYIKFTNSAESEYAVYGIKVTDRGFAGGDSASVNDNWTDNILPAGEVIMPGETIYFTLGIPNLDGWAFTPQVTDDTLGTFYLKDQYTIAGSGEGIIEHWGSDERTVDITLYKNNYSDNIMMNYSSWAGIE